LEAEYLFMAFTAYDQKATSAFFDGPAYQMVKLFGGNSPHHQLNGVFMVPAQGHVFLKGRYGAVNASLPVTPSKGLVQEIFVKTFSSGYLGSQEGGLVALVSISNLRHNLFRALGRQHALAFWAMLTAQFAV
jgi:hypothetical protein